MGLETKSHENPLSLLCCIFKSNLLITTGPEQITTTVRPRVITDFKNPLWLYLEENEIRSHFVFVCVITEYGSKIADTLGKPKADRGNNRTVSRIIRIITW